ncbi:DsrE family protein [Saccharospirillum mangrovi]|uniref:DsrE family protein n=1 Tax=Saccharospirillum mangrovi TaxID=2161747 RepID=UPI000D3B7565|nr:DsrE family protein [Saccharospirillum mangrovi]
MTTFETLVLITSAPYQQRRSEEILEAVMSLALFDREHAVVFWHDGLAWLAPEQNPNEGKSLQRQLDALPLYGSDALFYCREHQASVLGEQTPPDSVQPMALNDLAQLLRQARYVEVF